MSSIAALTAMQVAIPEGSAIAPAVVVLLTSGLVGMSIKNMFDSILSDDETADDGGGEDEMADGGGLMAEDDGGGDDFGDLGGLDDGDDMGGFGDDEFGDMDDAGGGSAAVDELEHQLDELENEVGSLSSTVSTVRTENEQISESVEEVEENVRKLLDIYEMVTRGVNPFADDIEAGMGGGMGGDSSFGLFDDGGDDEEADDIDEDIANADAEGFFDEDLVEDTDATDPSGGGSVEDVFPDEGGDGDGAFEDDGGTFDEDFEGEGSFEEDLDGGDDDGGEGGKSFQELKDEYESGDADWAEGEEPEDADADADLADDDADDLAEDDLFDDVIEDDGFADDDFDDVADETESDDESAAEPAPEPDAGSEPETATEPEPTPDPASATESEPEPTQEQEPAEDTQSTASSSGAADAGKPYLTELPAGFAGDLIVVEWLEYLLQQAGHREAARAIDYYETIDWIDEDVADDLQEILRGFDDVDGGTGGLTIDHHTRSLEYISQLDGGGAQSVALSKLVGGGDAGGLQR